MILVLVRIPITLWVASSLCKDVLHSPKLDDSEMISLLGYALTGAVLLAILWAPVISRNLSNTLRSIINSETSLPPDTNHLVQRIRWLQRRGWHCPAMLFVFIERVRHPNRPQAAVLGLRSARPGSFLERRFAREVFKFSNIQNCLYAYRVLTERHGITPLHRYPEINLAISTLTREPRPEPAKYELKCVPARRLQNATWVLADARISRVTCPIRLQVSDQSTRFHTAGAAVNRPKPQLPNHELIRCIGSGSFGDVWLALNVIGTYRAVKVVYRRNFSNERPYEREFRGLQKFEPISRSHDGFVDILDVGLNSADGYFYYVMELADDVVSGNKINPESYEPMTLEKDIIKRECVPVQTCVSLGVSLSDALAHLHQHGLVHRDIKPSNVIFVNGIPKIADIGLVSQVEGTQTFAGGTSGYFPPNRGAGTVQADIYALGKVLYQLSTGQDRFEFPALPAQLGEMQDPDQFRELNQVILKACEDDPRKRYRNARELHADLVLLLARKSVRRIRAPEKRVAQLMQVCTAARAFCWSGVAAFFGESTAKATEIGGAPEPSSWKYAGGRRRFCWGSSVLYREALRLQRDMSLSEINHRMRIEAVPRGLATLHPVRLWFPRP
jgi:hypothetical protein